MGDLIVAEAFQPPPRYGFLTGPAGSGKTTLVRTWCHDRPGMKLCATTGIAAVNLGDAVTVNSLLGYYNTVSLEESFVQGWLQTRLRKNRDAGILTYVLDEVSMLEARQLTALVQAFESLNQESAVLMGDEPAIGLILVGDFLQLPPVEGDYAFQCHEWDQYFAPHVQTLTQIHRQADPEFIAALRALRIGDASTAIAILRPCFTTGADVDFDGSTILAKNAQVDRYNSLRHGRIKTKTIDFITTQTLNADEKAPKDWETIPPVVNLRPGALVMILINKTDEGEIVYANGDLGEFIGTPEGQPKIAQVKLQRTGQVVHVAYNLRQYKRPNGKGGKRKDAYDILGEISYMPLRLAYSTTVHKSQGLSLDRVQVDISDPFWAAPAMLYVGISRARSLEGLRIVGKPELISQRCKFDPRVKVWR